MNTKKMESVNATIDKIVTDHVDKGYLGSSDISNLAWLSEQADAIRKIEETLVGIENNGNEFDKINFYTVVQDILNKKESN